MFEIRNFEERDWKSVWRLIETVFRAGETYAYAPDITEDEAYEVWVEKPSATFIAKDENSEIIGTYYIKPNQPGLGSHVCNCGYIVMKKARGKGVAAALCEHSQREAVSRGFRAMQYNFVVSTNETAVRLWKRQGFEIVGTVPQAYRHSKHGFVDAFVMYKNLVG